MRTPTIPAGTNQISFGVALYGTGTVITDNYSMANATVAASAVKCTAGCLHQGRLAGAAVPLASADHPHRAHVQREGPVRGGVGQ